MQNVYLQTYRNNWICLKLTYFLRKIQTLKVCNSRILMMKNAKFSGYCFYMNLNIWGDFRVCISLPLTDLKNSFSEVLVCKVEIGNKLYYLLLVKYQLYIFKVSFNPCLINYESNQFVFKIILWVIGVLNQGLICTPLVVSCSFMIDYI